MPNFTFTKLKYVNCFVADPPKSLLERVKTSKLVQLFLSKVSHIHLTDADGTSYYRNPVAIDIFEILLELSTVSLTDQDKYQEAAERYYLLTILPFRQWSWDNLSKKSRSDQIVHIGEVLAQWSKPFDISLVNKSLSRKPCERPKLDSQLLNAQETWKSLPHLWC